MKDKLLMEYTLTKDLENQSFSKYPKDQDNLNILLEMYKANENNDQEDREHYTEIKANHQNQYLATNRFIVQDKGCKAFYQYPLLSKHPQEKKIEPVSMMPLWRNTSKNRRHLSVGKQRCADNLGDQTTIQTDTILNVINSFKTTPERTKKHQNSRRPVKPLSIQERIDTDPNVSSAFKQWWQDSHSKCKANRTETPSKPNIQTREHSKPNQSALVKCPPKHWRADLFASQTPQKPTTQKIETTYINRSRSITRPR